MLSTFLSQKRLQIVLFFLIFSGIIIATLWPFSFSPSNSVSWVLGRKGIHFSQPGGVLVSASSLVVPPSSANNSVTIELWLRSDEIWSSRTVVGICNPARGTPFLIRQWNGGLFVSHDDRGTPSSTAGDRIYAKRLFQRGTPLFLTITSSPFGTAIYINAVQTQFFPGFQIHAGDLSGQVVLGTAPESYSPWRGDIYFLAMYATTLSREEIRQHYDSIPASSPASRDPRSLLARYEFTESSGSVVHSSVPGAPDLQIPKNFFLPHKPVLQSPLPHYETSWHYYRDALFNVLGFVPFGFLLCAWLGNARLARHGVLYSFLAGALFSFLIELIQGYIPQRDSGFNDVITNSLGALLGAFFLRVLGHKQKSPGVQSTPGLF
ncbi:MAG TPA: VanZ family protein [Candidatus Acidoferrum sp.]|nr:VanZ family protein [Candidatus Acidoferrum sp.]